MDEIQELAALARTWRARDEAVQRKIEILLDRLDDAEAGGVDVSGLDKVPAALIVQRLKHMSDSIDDIKRTGLPSLHDGIKEIGKRVDRHSELLSQHATRLALLEEIVQRAETAIGTTRNGVADNKSEIFKLTIQVTKWLGGLGSVAYLLGKILEEAIK